MRTRPLRMPAMSCRREAATKTFSFDLPPDTKREFFQASKYSDIVGVMTTSAVNASCAVGVQARRDALGREGRLGAPQRGLGEQEEVARLLERAAGRGLDRERDRVLRI